VAGAAGLQQCGSGWNARPMPGLAQRAEHRRPIYHVLLVGVAARYVAPLSLPPVGSVAHAATINLHIYVRLRLSPSTI